MELSSVEYPKYFRIGELATLRMEERPEIYLDLTCIIAQVNDVACELAVLSDELPASCIGTEIQASLSAMVGYLHCECPVIIGKNSFEQTAFVRFSGEIAVRIKRNYIRHDVLIPFLYEEARGGDQATRLVDERRTNPKSATFSSEPYGESFKALSYNDHGDLLPVRVNLGGGGVRFATVDPFPRNTCLALQIFLDWPEPRVVHAVLKVTRSKPFEQTLEDRAFYNWAKIRLKSQTISITAGSYEYIADEDRQFVVAYIQEMQSRHSALTVGNEQESAPDTEKVA